MQPVSLGAYLSGTSISLLVMPSIIILINQWRNPEKVPRRALLLALFLLLFNAAALAVFGLTEFTGRLVGYLSPAISWVCYIANTNFRDGRLLFTLITGMLLSSVDVAVATTFAPAASWASFIVQVVICILQFFILFFFCRGPYSRMLRTSETGWYRLSLVPLSLFVCLFFAHTYPVGIQMQRANPTVSLSLCVTILIIYISLYNFLESAARHQQKAQGYVLLNTQLRLLEQQAARLLAAQDDNRLFRHNLRAALHRLENCLQRGDTAGATELLRGVDGALSEMSREGHLRRYTGNTILDMVLTLAAERAAKIDAEFTAQLVLPQPLEADIAELSIMISETMDNALHSCAKAPPGIKREVHIYNSLDTKQFFLSIRNTCPGEVIVDGVDGRPLRDENGHPFNTESIRAFAQKYGAMLHFKLENGTFTTSMLL